MILNHRKKHGNTLWTWGHDQLMLSHALHPQCLWVITFRGVENWFNSRLKNHGCIMLYPPLFNCSIVVRTPKVSSCQRIQLHRTLITATPKDRRVTSSYNSDAFSILGVTLLDNKQVNNSSSTRTQMYFASSLAQGWSVGSVSSM